MKRAGQRIWPQPQGKKGAAPGLDVLAAKKHVSLGEPAQAGGRQKHMVYGPQDTELLSKTSGVMAVF